MADFLHADLRGSRFERVDLSGAQLRAVDLSGAQFRGVDLSGTLMQGAEPDTPGVPRDRAARPSLAAVPELRRDRMATVRQVIDGLTSASLDGHTEQVGGPGWPPPRSFPVHKCLLVILNEEWEHRLYAERDLDALQARGT